ncbi:TVP38/TMEM64 family protein [Nocardiopsis halotolerans]|uniref:TVP38/TMEM64 family protein n=1 Tax=Nocardiopsis halotolerans TaxID=124252 RepID=UPI00037CC529|nr:VTT domain-containing protein [Nocardiopsis halotolerans]
MGQGTRGVSTAGVSRLVLLLVWGTVLVLALLWGPETSTLRGWVEAAGTAGPLAYLGVYVMAVFALVPRPALNAAAGLLFGMSFGLVLALLGGVCAALAQLSVARHVAGDAVARLLPAGARTRLDALADGHALVAVIQLRLVPVIPYQAVNYGFGLTRIRVWPFALGTLVGGVPGTAALVLVGAGGADLGVPVAVGGTVLAVAVGVVWWLRSRRWRARA